MVSHTPLRPEAGDPESPPPAGPPQRTTGFHRWVERVVAASLSWGWLTVVIGLGTGLTAWTLAADDRVFVIENDLRVPQRFEALEWMGIATVVVFTVYGAVWAWRRFKGSGEHFGEIAQSLNRYAFVLALSPLFGGLAYRGLEAKHKFITLLLCAGITVGMGVLIYRVAALVERPASLAAKRRRFSELAPALALIAIGCFYAWYMSSLALLDHRNLGTHIYDLGIYDNLFYRTTHGDFLGCGYCKGGTHVAAHFDPIIWVFSPIYKLNPRAETILVLQSTWLATGVVPLYLLARRRLGNAWFGVLLAGIYTLYPALHGANMFDFHSLTLVIPSLIWLIYLSDSGSKFAYWFVLLLMLLTREDMSLLACFVGLYGIITRRPLTGIMTILLSLGYLYYVKTEMMPDSGLLMQGGKETMSYIYFYEDMIPHHDEGMKGLIISFFTNPVFVVKMLLIESKAFFFLALGLPLLFLPVLSGKKTIIMAYGLVFIGLATRRHMYSLHFQYSSVLFPVLLASMPDAVARAGSGRLARGLGLTARRLQWTLMITALLSTFLVSWKFGAWISNDAFKAGWNRLARNPGAEKIERYEKTRELVAMIPREASVSSTSGLGPQVSNRMDVKKWPSYRDIDFLLLYTKGFKKKDNRRLDRLLKRGEYRLLDGGMGVELFELVPKDERDAAREAARDLPPRAKGKKKKKKKGKRKSKADKDAIHDPNKDADEDDEDDEDDVDVAAGKAAAKGTTKPKKPADKGSGKDVDKGSDKDADDPARKAPSKSKDAKKGPKAPAKPKRPKGRAREPLKE